MKRRISLWVMAVAAACSFSVAAQEQKTELLPQVQAILYPEKPSDDYLKQDIFAGLLAFDAPQGMDYMAIGGRVIQSNFENYMQSVRERKNISPKIAIASDYYEGKTPETLMLEVNGQPYSFPCLSRLDDDCVEQTLAQKEMINKVIEQNPILMQRYEALKQLPHYSSYTYTTNDPFPAFQPLFRIREMILAQAIFAIEEGNVEQGLAILEQERAFDEKVFLSDAGLIDKMVTLRHWLMQVHITGVLLDYPAMKPYLATLRLQRLLAPLSTEQQKGIAKAFAHDFDTSTRTVNQMSHDAFVASLDSKEFPEGKAWNFNPNKTFNLSFLMLEPLLKRASMPIHEVSQFVLSGQATDVNDDMLKILHEESQKMGVQDNNLGIAVLERYMPGIYHNYSERFYDAQVFLALVNAKRCLLAAQVDLQDEAAVNAFLAGLGEQGRNPYDQKPFKWRHQERMLGTDILNAMSALFIDGTPDNKEVWINMGIPQ